MEVGDSLRAVAGELSAGTQQAKEFNEAAAGLTAQLVKLNRWLTFATIVIAIGTIVMAISVWL